MKQDIENGTVVDHASVSDTADDQQEQSPRGTFFTRKNLLILGLVALVPAAIVAIAVPLTRESESSATSGPSYQVSSTIHRNCSDVADITADGKRIFWEDEHNGGSLEVLDQNETDGTWATTTFVIPVQSENETLRSWDINAQGNALVTRTLTRTRGIEVRVFREEEGVWQQVGETIDEEFVVEQLGLKPTAPYSCQTGGPVQTSLVNFIPTDVAMSDDGNTILVASNYASAIVEDCIEPRTNNYMSRVGVVQAFQNTQTNSTLQDRFLNTTWAPLGNMIMGRFRDDALGEQIALSGDGHRFAAALGLFEEGHGGKAIVYDFEEESQEWTSVSGNNDLYLRHTRRSTDVLTMSRDGEIVGLAEADNTPSPYSPIPLHGSLTLFKESVEPDQFGDLFDTSDGIKYGLDGDTGFQHFGSRVALASDANHTVVVAGDNTRSSEHPNGDRIQVFHLNRAEWVPRASVPLNGETNWKSLAVDDSGRRFIAVRHTGQGYELYVYDLEE